MWLLNTHVDKLLSFVQNKMCSGLGDFYSDCEVVTANKKLFEFWRAIIFGELRVFPNIFVAANICK